MFEVDGIGAFDQEGAAELFDKMEQAIQQHHIPVQLPFGRTNYTPWIIRVPREDAAAVQATHIYRVSALDVRDLSSATASARKQVHDLMRVMRQIPGLEKLRLIQTAASLTKGSVPLFHMENRPEEVAASMEAKAKRIIAEELAARNLTLRELETMEKMHPVKAEIARRLRKETTMTWGWIALRLHGGSPSTMTSTVYQLEL